MPESKTLGEIPCTNYKKVIVCDSFANQVEIDCPFPSGLYMSVFASPTSETSRCIKVATLHGICFQFSHAVVSSHQGAKLPVYIDHLKKIRQFSLKVLAN